MHYSRLASEAERERYEDEDCLAAGRGAGPVGLHGHAGGPDGAGATAERARKIARDALIVDTHVDLPCRLGRSAADVTLAAPGGDFDYPRAVEGGLGVAFMSIYTPAEFAGEGRSGEAADDLIGGVEGLAARAPGKFAIVRSTDEFRPWGGRATSVSRWYGK